VVNGLLVAADASPLSPHDCLERADLLTAEEGGAERERAVALVHRAIDASPADREAHELLAQVLGPGPEGDDALRRALALHPWSVEVRDHLGLRLWSEGNREAGAAELEESMHRFPWFTGHTYLTSESDAPPGDLDPERAIRTLSEPDTLNVRLETLDPDMAAAIERGLRGAIDETVSGVDRAQIVDQLATLLEVRGRWAEAGDLLHAEAQGTADGTDDLARAARNYLKAKDDVSAEKALLAALLRKPDQGALYSKLAVKIYVPRGQFDKASAILDVAQRNAVDLMPVYRGVAEVLTQRELAVRSEHPPIEASTGGATSKEASGSDSDFDSAEDLP
jgi:hypothetical protein